MKIQGVLFDFDGIIADTERLHCEAFQQVLIPLGLGFSWEDYAGTYIGFDDRGVFQQVFAGHNRELPSERMAALIDDKARWFEAQAQAGNIPLFPGVEALIKEAAVRGWVGLCSGALRSDIEPILNQYDLARYFQCMVTAEDVPESKPHPASYELAAAHLQALAGNPEQLPTGEILAIEDTPAGIRSARGAGVLVAGIGHTYALDALADAHVVYASFEGLTLQQMEQQLNESTAPENPAS